jgi:hypothetical protein
MMDLASLEYVNRRATARAAKAKRVPLMVDQRDIDAAKRGDLSGVQIPYIDGRTPRGWRRVDISKWYPNPTDCRGKVYGRETFFVDKSGLGAPGEPALTFGEFLEVMRPGYGYAVTEEGPFQVYVGVFERCDREKRPAGVVGRCKG